jgi:hypothetical protein
MKHKVKVWNTQGQYIGDFEVPENTPPMIQYNNKIYQYNNSYGAYTEMRTQPYSVNTIWITNVKQ